MKNSSIKVLFVASGNSRDFEIAQFIKIQGESLKNLGVHVDYFPITEKGLKGYLKSGIKLKKYLKDKTYDLIHAHYTLSGWTAKIGSQKIPIVLSLMGDDAYGTYDEKGKLVYNSIYLIILTKLIQPFVKFIITKSANIEKKVFMKGKSSIIPNGINLKKFPILEQKAARHKLDIPSNEKIILFLGNPNDPRKNIMLANKALDSIEGDIKLLVRYPIPHDVISIYLAAANVLVFCSTAEGSPNVIKEAMACNCPIVSTNVGDIEWVLGNTGGCYLTSFDPSDVAIKIKKALKFSEEKGRTKGRERILELSLDSETVAEKIIKVYNKVLTEQ